MRKSSQLHWKQRLESYECALSQLEKACKLKRYSELERAGLIKLFEICFELYWRVMKDFLSYEGINETTPRSVIRKSFESTYIDENDCEVLLEALDNRNVFSHIYHSTTPKKAEMLIKNEYYPMLSQALDRIKTKASEQ